MHGRGDARRTNAPAVDLATPGSRPRRRRSGVVLGEKRRTPDRNGVSAPLTCSLVRETARTHQRFSEGEMGKYVLAWILGVPAFVLVLVYLIAH